MVRSDTAVQTKKLKNENVRGTLSKSKLRTNGKSAKTGPNTDLNHLARWTR